MDDKHKIVSNNIETGGFLWFALLIIMFYGDPDIADAIIHYLMSQ